MKTYTTEEVIELFKEYDNNYIESTSITEFLNKKELIDQEFEVGKWYKATREYSESIMYSDKIKGDDFYGYGFDYDGDWMNDDIRWDNGRENFIEATDKEVEEALINEAKNRGFKKGVVTDLTNTGNTKKHCVINYGNFRYNGRWLSIDHFIIFENGSWAEIVEEKKEDIDWSDPEWKELADEIKSDLKKLIDKKKRGHDVIINGVTYIKK